MAGRRSLVTDVREILRRLQLGEPDRRIARDLGVGRNTVARYRQWARDQGPLHAALPEPATLAAWLQPGPAECRAHEQSLVEPFRERVKALHDRGVEGQAIWQLLTEEHDFAGSYSSVKRFLRRLTPPLVRATCAWRSTRAQRRRWTSASAASSWIPRAAESAGPGSS